MYTQYFYILNTRHNLHITKYLLKKEQYTQEYTNKTHEQQR